MTENKKTVMQYIDGFNAGDHEKILSCLTDDVYWEMPGQFQLAGKEAFDKEIENDAFQGLPDITIIRLVEQDNIVVAEGEVKSKLKDGEAFEAVFCDVFHMQNGKIKQLSTYLMTR